VLHNAIYALTLKCIKLKLWNIKEGHFNFKSKCNIQIIAKFKWNNWIFGKVTAPVREFNEWSSYIGNSELLWILEELKQTFYDYMKISNLTFYEYMQISKQWPLDEYNISHMTNTAYCEMYKLCRIILMNLWTSKFS